MLWQGLRQHCAEQVTQSEKLSGPQRPRQETWEGFQQREICLDGSTWLSGSVINYQLLQLPRELEGGDTSRCPWRTEVT